MGNTRVTADGQVVQRTELGADIEAGRAISLLPELKPKQQIKTGLLTLPWADKLELGEPKLSYKRLTREIGTFVTSLS